MLQGYNKKNEHLFFFVFTTKALWKRKRSTDREGSKQITGSLRTGCLEHVIIWSQVYLYLAESGVAEEKLSIIINNNNNNNQNYSFRASYSVDVKN